MKDNFWQKLKREKGRPLMVLAPMADVTDASFRHVIAKYGKPDVTWTEFVSADGLVRATEVGKMKLLRDLVYSETERPIVAQLFGSNPEYMKQASKLVAELGFNGIDINMGCPDKSIEKQRAGAAMMKDPIKAREIIRAAKESGLPVSVKTRLGFNKDELEEWLPELLAENPVLITVHARTRKEMSKVPARWERVRRAVETRNEVQKDLPEGERTLIFGNGDVLDLADGFKKAEETGADGVMLGRAIFGNPWLFKNLENIKTCKEGCESVAYVPSIKEKLEVALEHTKLFAQILGDIKSFAIMKKHFKAYINGFDGSKELRAELMEAVDVIGVEKIINDFIQNQNIK